jgi:NADH dehydrogenase FAD-containing subunit
MFLSLAQSTIDTRLNSICIRIYLAKVFNGGGAHADRNKDCKPFVYRPLGSMAYIGDWQALVDWEKFGSFGKWSGFLTYIFWKSAYWTK